MGKNSKNYHLGHINESSFEQVWNGDKWQTLRQEHLSHLCPDAPYFKECSWCYKNRYIDFEHFFYRNLRSKFALFKSLFPPQRETVNSFPHISAVFDDIPQKLLLNSEKLWSFLSLLGGLISFSFVPVFTKWG
ncbi:MAG: SPASM domain-containing protein, partial [Dolichospermum sp.]